MSQLAIFLVILSIQTKALSSETDADWDHLVIWWMMNIYTYNGKNVKLSDFDTLPVLEYWRIEQWLQQILWKLTDSWRWYNYSLNNKKSATEYFP